MGRAEYEATAIGVVVSVGLALAGVGTIGAVLLGTLVGVCWGLNR